MGEAKRRKKILAVATQQLVSEWEIQMTVSDSESKSHFERASELEESEFYRLFAIRFQKLQQWLPNYLQSFTPAIRAVLLSDLIGNRVLKDFLPLGKNLVKVSESPESLLVSSLSEGLIEDLENWTTKALALYVFLDRHCLPSHNTLELLRERHCSPLYDILQLLRELLDQLVCSDLIDDYLVQVAGLIDELLEIYIGEPLAA